MTQMTSLNLLDTHLESFQIIQSHLSQKATKLSTVFPRIVSSLEQFPPLNNCRTLNEMFAKLLKVSTMQEKKHVPTILMYNNNVSAGPWSKCVINLSQYIQLKNSSIRTHCLMQGHYCLHIVHAYFFPIHGATIIQIMETLKK